MAESRTERIERKDNGIDKPERGDQAMKKLPLEIHLELTVFDGKPAIMFWDGDFFLMSDTIASFLMHASILAPGCELPDKLILIEDKKIRRNHEKTY